MKSKKNLLKSGALGMLPVVPGIIPFGLIMGSVAQNAGLTKFQAFGMNGVIFAGASQLASIDLMTQDTQMIIVILTGIVINLRFVLYSAAFSPVLKEASLIVKLIGAYIITDQSYAVVMANDSSFKDNSERILYFFGASICMIFFWHSSVVAGYFFGNIVPKSFSLDFAVPLSFMALCIPTLKTKIHVLIAIISSILSIILFKIPFNLGLMITGFLCIALAVFLTKDKYVQ